jgi:NTP pyrophosphatase (non-canonical NTP hydrolase)
MKEKEVLSILMEECSEVIQSVSKIFRFGLDTEWKGESNREHLEEEIGDLLCMIEILETLSVIDPDKVKQAKLNKYQKLKKWSTIFDEQN